MRTNKLEINFPVFQGDILRFSDYKKLKKGIQFVNKYFKVIEVVGKTVRAVELNCHNYEAEGFRKDLGIYHKIPDCNSLKNSKKHTFKLSIEFKTRQWKTICFKNELGKTYLHHGEFYNNGFIEFHKGKSRKLRYINQKEAA